MSKTEAHPPHAKGAPPGERARSVAGERSFAGIPVSSGIAIGPLVAASEPALKHTPAKIAADGVVAEHARLDEAVAKSRRQLEKLRARLSVLPEDSQHEIAPLIDAYSQMLSGSRLLRQARKRIAEQLVSAETAVHDEAEKLAAAMLALPGDDPASNQRRGDE